MSISFNKKADEALKMALKEYESANEWYVHVIQRFASSKSFIPGEEIRHPEAILDASGLKEFDEAYERVESASKKLRKVFMKLYQANH
jgi:hypothetical protein